MAELEHVKGVYGDLRERDWVVTLTLLAHDLWRHNLFLKELSVYSVHRRSYQHLVKQCVVRRLITRVAHNTRYDQDVKHVYVSDINDRYRPQDIVLTYETNFYSDQDAG
jgi:hypothetical protein